MSASHYPNQFTWMPFPRKYLYQYVIWVYIYIFFLQHPGILLCQVKEYHARISHIIPLFVTNIILRLRFHCKCRPSNLSEISIFIPPASTKLIGGYTGITLSVCPSVRPSVCPSVRLWTESCPLCIFKNTHRIHFIFAHLIKQLQKVCRV